MSPSEHFAIGWIFTSVTFLQIVVSIHLGNRFVKYLKKKERGGK